MPSNTVNICVLTLVLLSFQHMCHSKPHGLNKREIIKDYHNPAIFSPQEFEKGEDGKYYLKKDFHRMDSEVSYVEDKNTDEKDENNSEAADVETIKAVTEPVQATGLKNERLKEMSTDSETAHRLPAYPQVEFVKGIPRTKSEIIYEELSEKVDISKDKAPFTPIDPKSLVPPKPNSKDEIATKTDLPPISEGKDTEKVAIGQVPQFYPRIISIPDNLRLPIFIPIHRLSYGTVSVLPFPPVSASDRLPLPFGDDEIVGEDGPETDSSEDAGAGQKEPGLPLGDPYVPALPFTGTFLKDLKDAAAKQGEKQSKVVDVLGKKFLMQSNVMKYPRGDNGNTYVRFMSVQPLEAVGPKISKEATAKAAAEDKFQEEKHREMKELGAKKTDILAKEDELLKTEKKLVKTEMKKEKDAEKEILKAEETQIKPKEIANPESSFIAYEDPYVKGLKDMISESKKHSFVEEISPVEESGEEAVKKIVNEELESKIAVDKTMFKEDNKKENEDVDTLSKGGMKPDVEMDGKEEFFFLKNKRREVADAEESAKPKTKNEKKMKKKCKCEEKDSDSEDDE